VPERTVEFLLVGGGIASGNCARHLREEGAQGDILIVGREPDPPYSRPPLSKGYLRGEESRADVLFRPEEWYAEQRVEVLTRTSVMSLDVDARVAKLSTKEEVRFDKALLATGSNVRILRAAGAHLDGIHYLRTIGNSDALRDEAANSERVAIVGGSYIATELAASFTALGKQCEIVMLEDVTLERVYGREVGRFFQDTLTEHGVKVHGGQELERFEGEDRVRKLVTKSGLEIDCDFVAIGAGVTPDTTLAQRAGLETDSGVLVDRYLETSAPGIFAAGDIAEYDSVIHDRRLRIEHWDVAFNHGRYAALNMVGKQQEYDVVPYFWSDLADWCSMEYVGPAAEWDEVWIRGSLDAGRFTAFYVKDGRLAAALTVGRSDDLAVAARLLKDKTDISALRARIEDPRQEIETVG
jgi:3-phenylpropionate/trans-cinnamate dioxygenase ferredoxin reductase component